jgi:hypothetical protein
MNQQRDEHRENASAPLCSICGVSISAVPAQSHRRCCGLSRDPMTVAVESWLDAGVLCEVLGVLRIHARVSSIVKKLCLY